MVFNSITFFVFFCIVFFILLLTKLKCLESKCIPEKLNKFRKFILFIASYVFYGWWDWRFCFLMLGLTYIAYITSLFMDKYGRRKIFIALGVSIPLICLGVFKYFNFFVQSFETVFHIKNTSSLNIILPVGISFYTFQSLSYSIDVYRGEIQAEKSFMDVALYISFFPQLVAGPIVKANDFLPQLKENRCISAQRFSEGIQIFLFGLFKKIVLSDNIAVFVDSVFSQPGIYSYVTLLLGVVSYSIQIYCDFSGYSDMAIGIAYGLGYDLKQNFNLPYISKNISEFWKRWHISLSTWLMEYLYFPLGGNRKGKLRTYLNLFVTMVLGGLWHGANWTFVIWGAIHGVALCVQKKFSELLKHNKEYKGTVTGNLVSCVFTYAFVCFCWIFFRAESFENANEIIYRIATLKDGITHIYSWSVLAIVLLLTATLLAIIKSVNNKEKSVDGYYAVMDLTTIKGLIVFFLAAGITIALAHVGNNPFIYFQF